MQDKMQLDELELCIQLLQIYNPELKQAKYQEIADVVEVEFGKKVDVQDVFLLYEPTIDEEITATQEYFGSMFNYSREIY